MLYFNMFTEQYCYVFKQLILKNSFACMNIKYSILKSFFFMLYELNKNPIDKLGIKAVIQKIFTLIMALLRGINIMF